ncbi:uncharacterized protein AB675_7724 [Cyphellophora attinorum]|uniref:F-box domain-containing protein n=1 Tax=Cyphellophora attinorum TaxID=1664694 RepID=A0A0N1P0F1_9EURO|nr:uncharacterized protein AB675_7724 [Phialophora attinorum]KPI40315.1 hypothetical protein AB675_7724 [Phialophora attinorum]
MAELSTTLPNSPPTSTLISLPNELLRQILAHALPKRIHVAATGRFEASHPGRPYARQRLFWNDENVLGLTLVSKQVAEIVGPLIYERMEITPIDVYWVFDPLRELVKGQLWECDRSGAERMHGDGKCGGDVRSVKQVREYLRALRSLGSVGRRGGGGQTEVRY